MATVSTDGTLVRGSIVTTISTVDYVWLNFTDSIPARVEKDYDEDGKPAGSSTAEDFRELTGTIRVRSGVAAPPKFTEFTYDSTTFQIIERDETGSTEGLKEYNVRAMENVGTITTS